MFQRQTEQVLTLHTIGRYIK